MCAHDDQIGPDLAGDLRDPNARFPVVTLRSMSPASCAISSSLAMILAPRWVSDFTVTNSAANPGICSKTVKSVMRPPGSSICRAVEIFASSIASCSIATGMRMLFAIGASYAGSGCDDGAQAESLGLSGWRGGKHIAPAPAPLMRFCRALSWRTRGGRGLRRRCFCHWRFGGSCL